jgi:predicted nucleotidyltransferase
VGSVFEATARELRKKGTPHALIGAVAMAGRGVMRSTDDLDLFVVDRAVLRPDYWTDVEALGFTAQLRLGDDQDPLAGVVRLTGPEVDHPVDVVVGKKAWHAEAIERAEPYRLGALDVPLVLTSDLILLKLYAGAAQDLLDVQALLDAGDRSRLITEVSRSVGRLPPEAREHWQKFALNLGRGR